MLKKSAARVCGGILTLCLLFSACNENGASNSAPASAQGAASTTSAEPGAAPAWQTFLFGQESPGPDGCYVYRQHPEGGCNILYADYATGRLVYLCNRPECTHASDSCTSYHKEGDAYQIAYCQNRVYMLDMNAGQEHIPYLLVCDANGENTQKLTRIESGSMMLDRFTSDGAAFYTLQDTHDEATSAAGARLLLRIGLEDGAKRHVSEKDYSGAAMLGGVGNEVVLITYTIPRDSVSATEQAIVGVDKTTGEERQIYNAGAGRIAGARDGFAYVLRMEDGAVDAVNLATGEANPVTFDKTAIQLDDTRPDVAGMAPEDAQRILASPRHTYYERGIFDGKLFLECYEAPEQAATYAIDLSTGQVSRISLAVSGAKPGSPISIKAEVGDDFLVMRDYIIDRYTAIGPDGVPFEQHRYTNRYALIAKEDFYASNPNYRDFVLS